MNSGLGRRSLHHVRITCFEEKEGGGIVIVADTFLLSNCVKVERRLTGTGQAFDPVQYVVG